MATTDIQLTDYSRHLAAEPWITHPAPPGSQTDNVSRRHSSQIPDDAHGIWSHEDLGDVGAGGGPSHEIEQANLPRADGGKEAWLFLAGCFTIEALVWGK
jgi:hypothetical protein